jgi:thiol-disulfide isomerase/thioredoxin
MNAHTHRTAWILTLLSCVLITLSPSGSNAQETEQAETEVAAERFSVPDGSPEELLKFIEKLAEPEEPYSTRAEIRQVAASISEAADKILAADTTDTLLKEAVEWRIGALSTLAQLGDREASAEIDQVLARLADDPRPVVASFAKFMQVAHAVERWYALDQAQKQAAINQLVTLFETVELEPRHPNLLFQLGDMVADTDDTEIITPALEKLVPLVKQSENPMVARAADELEGILRRVNLLGNKLELEGQLLEGEPLDWESYRGKVVLVDFWAVWCGPCRAEVPNLLEHYRMYKDKGFEILGVSLDDERAAAEQYVEQTAIPWATVFDKGSDTSMATKYAINAIPRLILVDQEGTVVHMNARGEILTEQLAKLLGEPAVAAAELDSAPDSESSQEQTAQTKATSERQ